MGYQTFSACRHQQSGRFFILILTWILIVGSAHGHLAVSSTHSEGPGGRISGRIVDAVTGVSVAGASVVTVNGSGGTQADAEGRYLIDRLDAGDYSLQFSHIGYETRQVDDVSVRNNDTHVLDIRLKKAPIDLKGMTVVPGRYAVMGSDPTTSQIMTRRDLATVPQLGEDLYRAINRLPGITSNEFSARFNVRGGEYEQLLVTLDGLLLYEPFHLKDIEGGALTIIDAAAVDGIELITGGFGAEYGDRMSGVLSIRSRRPPINRRRFSFGISVMNVRVMSEGTFNNNRGSWLFSAKRGYMDLIQKLDGRDDKLDPRYYDLFAKVQHQIGGRHVLAAHFLRAGDNLLIAGSEDYYSEYDTLVTSFDNTYGWLTLYSEFSGRLMARTMISLGKVGHDRSGRISTDHDGTYNISRRVIDTKSFRTAAIKSDWEWEVSERSVLKLGVETRGLATTYDYEGHLYRYYWDSHRLIRIDTVLAQLEPSGVQLGGYLAGRFRIAEPLTVELGLRYDRMTYSDDETFSPRINFVCRPGLRTSIRAGWGYFYQAQGIDGLMVGDRENSFNSAERAEHWIIGLEHDFPFGLLFRAEGYVKKYSALRPRFRNLLGSIEAFPEMEYDRVIVHRDGAESRGLEVFLKKDVGRSITLWASYALAQIQDDVSVVSYLHNDNTERYDKTIPSPIDQRHTIYLDVNYRPTQKWQINVSWRFHTGWPYADSADDYSAQLRRMCAVRYGNYSRVDLRVNRDISIFSGHLTAYIELINLLGRKNIRSYYYETVCDRDGCVPLKRTSHWLGTLPLFGISYTRGF